MSAIRTATQLGIDPIDFFIWLAHPTPVPSAFLPNSRTSSRLIHR